MEKKRNDTRKTQKLMLHTETLRILNEKEIKMVAGGGYDPTLYSCAFTDCPHI